MSETKAKLDAAVEALETVAAMHREAQRRENELLARLVELREKRANLTVNPIDASFAIGMLSDLDEAEAALSGAERASQRLYDLKRDLEKAHARAAEDHRTATERNAKPAAQQALDESEKALAKWARDHASRVLPLCRAAGVQTSGIGFSQRFVDVIAKHCPASFGR